MYIAIASGKGGTGKTLVATALAYCAGNCTYVDLDVEEPNGYIFLKPQIEKEVRYTLPIPEIDQEICTFCEKCAAACVYNAVAVIPSLKKAVVFPDLCHSCGCCIYVCPTAGAIKEKNKGIGAIRFGKSGAITFIEGRLDVGRPSGVPLISGIVNDYLDRENLLIVDSSPGTSCPVVESLKKSDYVILVTEPTPFGLNDLELTVEIIKDMGKAAGIIINKDNGKKSGIEELSQNTGIPILLRIPYSMKIQTAYSRGIPVIETLPGIKAEFLSLLKKISGEK